MNRLLEIAKTVALPSQNRFTKLFSEDDEPPQKFES